MAENSGSILEDTHTDKADAWDVMAKKNEIIAELQAGVVKPLGYVNVWLNEEGEHELGSLDLDETPDAFGVKEVASEIDGMKWVGTAAISLIGADLATPPADALAKAVEALQWYADQVNNCNRHGPEGGDARDALAKDTGDRARAALDHMGRDSE